MENRYIILVMGMGLLLVALAVTNSTNISIIGDPIDSYSETLLTNDYEKSKIFDGDSYIYSSSYNLSLGETKQYLLVTENKNVHLRNLKVACESGIVELKLNEDVTTTNDGTTINNIINKNRNKGLNTQVDLFVNPVVSSSGNNILIDGLIGNKIYAGNLEFTSDEIILKTNTNYLVSFENLNGNNNNCYFSLFWYEK